MLNAKPVKIPLATHFQLSSELCPKIDDKAEYMARVPYTNAIRCLMYTMVCTRLDISLTDSVVSKYVANPGK